jgi:hypothetical protein
VKPSKDIIEKENDLMKKLLVVSLYKNEGIETIERVFGAEIVEWVKGNKLTRDELHQQLLDLHK